MTPKHTDVYFMICISSILIITGLILLVQAITAPVEITLECDIDNELLTDIMDYPSVDDSTIYNGSTHVKITIEGPAYFVDEIYLDVVGE